MKISTTVVIPNWNGLSWLKACLASLKEQTRPFKLLVVDNGSEDGSAEYTEEQLTEWASFLMNDITGFSLGSDYLTLYYEDIYHHAQEFFPGVADDEIWKFSTGPQMIHYEDLGYHILNIFR